MSAASDFAIATTVSPLTVLVRGVLEWTFPDATVEDLFHRHAPGQATRKLTLSAIVELLIQVVAGTRRSVFAAFQADQAGDHPTLPASYQALYAKIGRTTPAFATQLVRHSADRLLPVLDIAQPQNPGHWWGYRVRILDGTDLGGSEHRLKVLRDTRAAGLPGRLVVAYDLATGLCVDAVASEDAYASEMVLVHELIPRARPRQVYVADRNFCTWAILTGLAQRRAGFVIREHQKLRVRVRGPAKRVGRVETGVAWEQRVWVEDRHTGQRLAARRVILKLDDPTRDGDTAIRLLTNLPRRIPATAIALVYRRRWTLEGHFDFVKNQLQGEIESLGRPRAALLMMCLAVVAANALAVVRQALVVSQEVELSELSGYYLADELAGNARAVEALVATRSWQSLASRPVAAFWDWCVAVSQVIRPAAFQKHPRGPKRPQPQRASGKKRPHYSTHRLLEEAKQRC
jgi:hypothetical protein